jgi:hypothetical protein
MKTWFIILGATAALIVLGLYAVANAQSTPNMTVAWQRDTLHITWQAPGYHCVWIDQYPLTCGVGSGSVDLPQGGIDAAYQPRPGRVLRLVSADNTIPARAVVPTRVFRVVAPWVVR